MAEDKIKLEEGILDSSYIEKGRCNHSLNKNVHFGGRKLIDLIIKNGTFEFTSSIGEPRYHRNIKLQFCTKCGHVIIKN